ncbi:MAG: hypothetical protein H6719_18205 [Sandaracinaceae bacterium]|nr:hypothetical protein [Sandaracinaceae bacterium]
MSARYARLGFVALTAAALLASCEPSAPEDFVLDLPRYEVIGSVSELVDPATGAVLTIGGATLEIPPGSLGGPAEISLIETTYPLQRDAHDTLSSAGQVPLSDSAFLISSDREVALTSALYLDLPVDAARLPAGATLEEAMITAYAYGYLHPQGRAASVGDGTVRVPITVASLPEGPPIGAPPRGEGVSFFALNVSTLVANAGPIAVGTIALGAFFQPIMATIEGGPGYQTVSTTSFDVHYRDGVTEAEALELGAELERARAFYVDELGFSLPNVGSYFTRYDFYVADLDSWREYLPERFRSRAPDGGTWAGSALWGGSSYLNATRTQPERISTAMHEYFHAVQWGATHRFAPNSLAGWLDPEGLWLIEGSATAMAGRLHWAAGSGPSRDPSQTGAIHRGRSIFDPNGHDPAPDVTQDFFVFLEQRLGDATFYREMLEAVTDDSGTGGIEPSVVAVDDVLLARSGGASGLSAAWTDFVRELLWTAPEAYGGVDPEPEVRGVRGDGAWRTDEVTLPPLSYEVQELRLARYADDAPLASQASDLEVEVTVTGDSVLQVDLQVGVPGGTPQHVDVPGAGAPATVVLPRVRDTDFATVWVTSTNPFLGNEDVVHVSVRARVVPGAPLMPLPDAPPAIPTCPASIDRPFMGAVETYVLRAQEGPFLSTLRRYRVDCDYHLLDDADRTISTAYYYMRWQPFEPTVYDAWRITVACGDAERFQRPTGVLYSTSREALTDVYIPFGDVLPEDFTNLNDLLDLVEPLAIPCR